MAELLKGMANVLLTLAILSFGVWWIFFGWPDRTRLAEDPIYAKQVFEGLLPVSEVLASRKWHAKGADSWDCTYAIVRTAENRPDVPPVRPRQNELGWQYSFGGDWQPTPEPPLRDNLRRALAFCRKYWPDALGQQLSDALNNPGAWYFRGVIGESLYIYAPNARLAAKIRFGD